MLCPLTEIKPKQKAKIKDIQCGGLLKRRMIDMGMVPGVEVEVVRSALWGGPLLLRLKGYYLAMRQKDCAHILVEC